MEVTLLQVDEVLKRNLLMLYATMKAAVMTEENLLAKIISSR